MALTNTADADLVGWWRFDEGSGTTAFDSSGSGNDASFEGSPTWVEDGKFGKALKFNGSSDYLAAPDSESLDINGDQLSIAAWINGEDWPAANHVVRKIADTGTGSIYMIRVQPDSVRVYLNTSAGETIVQGTTVLPTNKWVHIALTYDGAEARIFVNGQLDVSSDASGELAQSNNELRIGRGEPAGYFVGMIDDVRLYNHALTESELLSAMEGSGAEYPFACGPEPADGALFEATWASLSWRAGDFAISHDVYIGENFDDVNDGAEGTFQGNQAGTSLIVGFPGFAYPDGLVPGTTYYWRIDEVNDADPNSPWKGTVWSFTIPPKTAYDPVPADGVKFVIPNMELSWTAGFGAKLHHVCFGDNFDDVNNAVVGIPQAATSYSPGTLELDKVYYWRIDEFDGAATHKGDVWSFKTLPDIPITDPNLVGWWKLDEDMGTTAVDWSGHGNHGTLMGDPQWVPGFDGDALELDGTGDYVQIPPLGINSNTVTMTAWVKRDGDQTGWAAIIFHRTGGRPCGIGFSGQAGMTNHLQYHWNDNAPATYNFASGLVVPDDEWAFVAVVVEPSRATLYLNGTTNFAVNSIAHITQEFSGPLLLGLDSNNMNRIVRGTIDNARVYNKALTIEEIKLAMRGDPLLAWGPKPTNGSTLYIRDATPLSWSKGDNASGHDVYFGTDRDAVADADASDTTGIYRGQQGVTIYTPAEGVEWGGGPYYWRVDEYNTDATISKGNVWTFTVADFIEIDGFEDYNDYPPDEIFSTWIDGWEVPTNGSLAGHTEPPFAETGNVHGGGQSMPLYYDNNFMYSEATMTLVYPRDWTEEGVGILSLWFYGDAANAAEWMYVALNGVAMVYHDDSDAALIEEWTEWRIDLQEFAAQGVNLANVNTISIGFGDKNNLQAAGSGMVLFDDIRLYRPAPGPEPAP